MDNDPIAEERARLAAQLRTSLLDPLALLVAQATAFEQAAGQDERQRAAFAVVAALARQALQRARDLEADLDDARLEQLGLEASLDMLCGRAMRASPASVELSLPRLRGDLPPAVAQALLRFAQDALARATGPAYARRVRLRLSRDEARVALSVADDGDPAAELVGGAEAAIIRLGGSISHGRAAHGGLELLGRAAPAPRRRPHPARARGAGPAGRRTHHPRYRRADWHGPAHRHLPPGEHLRQARRRRAGRGDRRCPARHGRNAPVTLIRSHLITLTKRAHATLDTYYGRGSTNNRQRRPQ